MEPLQTHKRNYFLANVRPLWRGREKQQLGMEGEEREGIERERGERERGGRGRKGRKERER